jgi:hypothetical protein
MSDRADRIAGQTLELFVRETVELYNAFSTAVAGSTNGNKEALRLASVQLWQAHTIIAGFFKDITVQTLKGAPPADRDAAQAAAIRIADVMNGAMRRIGELTPGEKKREAPKEKPGDDTAGEVTDTPSKTDKSLN